jgi:VWFA-related protein
MKINFFKILLLFLIIGGVWWIHSAVYGQDHQKLEYDVAVSARIVPVFAVDEKGNPVYDIKKDEIFFYVNGKPVSFRFERFTFRERPGISVSQPVTSLLQREPAVSELNPAEMSRRAIFLIFDSTFNSREGLRRSKKIAARLFQNKSPGDDFILLENTPGGGLKYITGPEDNNDKLNSALKKMNVIPERFHRRLYSKREGSIDLSTSGVDPTAIARIGGKLRYKNFARRFTFTLRSLKYALKTISRPKIVFLISEGIQRGAILDSDTRQIDGFLLKNLKRVAQSVNEGGSILYTINPRKIEYENLRDEDTSGELSMNLLARESGGKYFEGSDPVVVAKEIKKSTAAYYELSFTITPEMGDTQKLELQCSRPGVRIHSISRLTTEKPYLGMKPVEKKLFALNVANQGTWSRMVAKIRKVSYKMLKIEKKGKTTIISIQVPIPAHLRTKKVDIFMIRTGKKDDNIDFGFNRKTAGDIEILTFEKKMKRKHFFVIIEPTTPYCIYNKLKL